MKPFHGITFCPTEIGTEQTAKDIAKKVIKLGGTYSRDLTRQVNVLILGKTILTSNKYKFAVRHRNDMVFIQHSVITELYQLWVAGSDITYRTHQKFKEFANNQPARMLHVLGTRFYSRPLIDHYIFIGRITPDNGVTLPKLEELCHAQSCYKCNTTQFIKDTARTNPNKRVIFISDNLDSLRVQAAQDEGIPVVHYKWIVDSYKRNATLEYDPYYLVENILDTPYDDIGKGTCDSISNTLILPSKDDEQSAIQPSNVIIDKFKPEGEKLWQRALKMTKDQSHTPLPLQKSTKKDTVNTEIPDDYPEHGIFNDMTFCIHNSFTTKQSQILAKVIVQNNGHIVEKENTDYYLIPSNIPMDQLNNLQTSGQLVTDFFIERCLHYKKLLELDSWSKPFYHTGRFNVNAQKPLLHNDDEMIHISITGFYGVELLHLNKILTILKPMGIQFSEYLNSRTDILLLNIASIGTITPDHDLWQNQYADLLKENLNELNIKRSPVFRNSMKKKIEFVKHNHSIPVVTPAFLMDIFRITKELNSTPKDKIFLNNKQWCILCPKGKKYDFCCEIIANENKLEIKEDLQQELSNKLLNNPLLTKHTMVRPSSISASAREIVSTIKESAILQNQKIKRRVTYIEKEPENESESEPTDSQEQPERPHAIKRHKVNPRNKIQPVSRSSSWGTMISNEVANNEENLVLEQSNIQIPATIAETSVDQVSYTQVTYGHSTTNRNSEQAYIQGPSKRMTRHKAKELGI